MKLFHNIRKLYTPLGTSARRGAAMREIALYENAAMLVDDDGRIVNAGPMIADDVPSSAIISSRPSSAAGRPETRISIERIDCQGLLALPGFVDSHTHCVFAGERSHEFAMRAEGRTYQEIAAAGGGIRASVEQVRASSLEEIVRYSRPFVERALRLGTTTMELKSGYGLTVESERKLLKAMDALEKETGMEVVKTFLGAHAVPAGATQATYAGQVADEQLPALHYLAEFCDVFMDEGYFTREETLRICEKAKALGLKIKLHADELADTGAAKTAVELGALSADHLLRVSEEGIRALARSHGPTVTVATLLPITALNLRAPMAPARTLIDAGCAVAIATDCNPGSSMSENMQFAVTLAVISMQMTPAEALTAATLNGAAALDRATTHGTLEPRKFADFVLYDIPALDYLPYHIAMSDVAAVLKRGEFVMSAL